ncbi:MAG: NlpC/P60 family protein [Myxococcota bacterium]
MGRLLLCAALLVSVGGCSLLPWNRAAEERRRQARNDALVRKMDHVVRSYLGTRYRLGGNSHKGIDCSGLLVRIYEAVGIRLPRTASAQYDVGRGADSDELQYGDILFFNTKPLGRRTSCLFPGPMARADVPLIYGLTHSGMYVGRGRFVHASSSSGVSYAHLDDEYWQDRFIGARRILDDFD